MKAAARWTKPSKMFRVREWALATTLGGVALGACAADASTTSLGTVATEIAVRPSDFLLGAACSATPGAIQSYVVTLMAYDDPSDSVAFRLPSSLPTPCSLAFAMRDFVVAGKLYAAEIDGYDVPSSALTPFGGFSSGSRQMLDTKGAVVPPRWTSSCGGGSATATAAVANLSTPVTGCAPLVDGRPSPTETRIHPDALLDAEACVLSHTLMLRLLSGTLALPTEFECDAGELAIPGEAGDTYRFYAHATRPDGSELGTECSGVVVAGQSGMPACDVPSPHGFVALNPSSVVHGGVPTCPTGAVYEVQVSGVIVGAKRTPCELPSQLGPLSPGLTDIVITAYDASGKLLPGSANCKADVEPGRLVTAFCL